MITVTVGVGKDYSTVQAGIDAVIALGALTDDVDIVCSAETFTAAASTILGNFSGLNANGRTVTLRGLTLETSGWPIFTQTNDGANLFNADAAGVNFKWCYMDKVSSGSLNYLITALREVAQQLHCRMASSGGSGQNNNQRVDFCSIRDATNGAIGLGNATGGIFNSIFESCTRGLHQTGSTPMDYNSFSNCTNVGKISGVDYTTLAAWRTASGQDANSIEGDATLISATNLHLLRGSPCIDAGIAVIGITTDIDGHYRSSPPDIGADEYFEGISVASILWSPNAADVLKPPDVAIDRHPVAGANAILRTPDAADIIIP